MRIYRLAAAIGSTLVLTLFGATSAHAAGHQTLVSGFEFQATSTQGRFAGTASGQGTDGLWGAWSIVVDHRLLGSDTCGAPPYRCAQITGGSFALAVTSPTPEFITGNFDSQDLHTDGIVQESGFAGCMDQRFRIRDSMHSVGTGSQHTGTGAFAAVLTHHRRTVFGSCVTYAATVSGTVSLTF